MDGAEAEVEFSKCDPEKSPNKQINLQASTSGTDLNNGVGSNAQTNERIVAESASDENNSFIRSEKTPFQDCDTLSIKSNLNTSSQSALAGPLSNEDTLGSVLQQEEPSEGQLFREESQEPGTEKHCEVKSKKRKRVGSRGRKRFSGARLRGTSQDQTLNPNSTFSGEESAYALQQKPDSNNGESKENDQSSFDKLLQLTQGSSQLFGDSNGHSSSLGALDQYRNSTLELKNEGNSQRAQQETSANNIQVAMLATTPESTKTSNNTSTTITPGSQFLNDDVFTPQNQGVFPTKVHHPDQATVHMDHSQADFRETLPGQGFGWINSHRTGHSQGHSLTELSRIHGNKIDIRHEPFYTDSNTQRDIGKTSSLLTSEVISHGSSSEKRDFFSGSDSSYPQNLPLDSTASHLIHIRHKEQMKNSTFTESIQLPSNANLRPVNPDLVKKSVIDNPESQIGDRFNKTSIKSPNDLLNPSVLDHQIKSEFSNHSLILNKGYPFPFHTPCSSGGIRAPSTSTSVTFLSPSISSSPKMSLSSPGPIVCPSLTEVSSSRDLVKTHPTSYPNDAHSAPPLDSCSNQAHVMRPPSAPVCSQAGTKSPFCCDECTKMGGISEKCTNRKSSVPFHKPIGNLNNTWSQINQISPPSPSLAGQQNQTQSAFMSAQLPHPPQKNPCLSLSKTSPNPSPSNLLVSPYHNSSITSNPKHDFSQQNPISTNLTHSGASSCFHPKNIIHTNNSSHNYQTPSFYAVSSLSSSSKTTSHNTMTYVNHISSSHSNNNNDNKNNILNNNASLNKPHPSFEMPIVAKAGRTVTHTPLEDLLKMQHQGYLALPSSSSEWKLSHVSSTPNLVTPLYTSSIYTCSSNTSTFSSSTQSNQSQLRMGSMYDGYPNVSNLPAPPSYSEVIQQKNSKNPDLLTSQNLMSGCKNELWQPFSEEKPMVHIKTEVITGGYEGEEPMSSQLPCSSHSSSFGPLPFQEERSGTSAMNQIPRQSIPSHSHHTHTAVPQSLNKHPMHPPNACDQPMLRMKADIKPKLGENGTSFPSNYQQQKTFHNDTSFPPGDNKQFSSQIPKPGVDPSIVKNEIKCTFKIKNSDFSQTHFQNAFLNSCPKNTNVPPDKMNRISNALNETTKRIFNHKQPAANERGTTQSEGASDERKDPDQKPYIKTEPSFDSFPNGSKTETDLDNEDLFKRLKTNRKMEIPLCGCLGPGYVPNETIEGPYYTHLGTGSCIEEIKKMMEERTGLSGKAVRVEQIIYSGKEGKSTQGCPIAKWIVRRSGVEEKILCLVRQRRGHICPTACIIICIVAWEGVPKSVADDMYSYLGPTLTEFGLETDRRCGYNEQKTCACQGVDMKKRGASFSFGCSWSMYFNGCKFARSREAKKFRLKDASLDEVTENKFQNLATRLAPLYKSIAPESYLNQVFFEDKGYECRLGHRTENDEKPCRPFSGVTACVDFCAHAHKDLHNMNNGCTVVVTLTKHGPLERPTEEQLHVLPLYILDVTNESLEEKLKSGGIEILANYPKVARIRAIPVTPKRKGKNAKKDSPSKRKQTALASKLAKNSNPVFQNKIPKATTFSGFNNNNNNNNKTNLFPSPGEKNMQLASSKGKALIPSSTNAMANPATSLNKQVPLPANANMYDEFWKYFYSYGTFPPANFLKDGNSADSMKLFASHLKDGNPAFAPPNTPVGNLLQQTAGETRKDPASTLPPNMKDLKPPYPVSNLTSDDFESPLHLLSEAVMIRSQTSVEKPRPTASHQQAGMNVPGLRKPVPNPELASSMKVPSKGSLDAKLSSHLANSSFSNPNALLHEQHSTVTSLNTTFDQNRFYPPNAPPPLQVNNSPLSTQPSLSSGKVAQPECADGCTQDVTPEVISTELEYNEQNFDDPEIGGVAIALTHGSVLFEVAKRELHATTALLNPNRFKPTRISLVFYQHKSMNLRYHGWYENERKLELQRQKRLQKLQEEAEKNQPIPDSDLKPASRKRRKKEELPPVMNCPPKYQPMWPASIKHTITQTTNTIITQWIDPQPMVTGPYQKWM